MSRWRHVRKRNPKRRLAGQPIPERVLQGFASRDLRCTRVSGITRPLVGIFRIRPLAAARRASLRTPGYT